MRTSFQAKQKYRVEIILICTPFTGQTGERGIIMRYSFEFKLECIEMYERGEFPDTPDGVSTRDSEII